MIKNLIFDFGKVLVDYDFEKFFRQHIPDPIRCREFSTLLNTDEMLERFDRELIPIEETIEELKAEHPHFKKEISIFSERYPEIVTGEMEGMYQLLSRLKEEGYRLYGLTNWCTKVYVTMKQYDIFNLLDGYVISSEEHQVKPEPEIYQCLLDRYNLNADECVFTDDKAVNIVGAEKLGIRGIVFKDAWQFETELKRLLNSCIREAI